MTAEDQYDSQPTQPLAAITARMPASHAPQDSQESEVSLLRQQLVMLQQEVARQHEQIAALVHQLNQPVAAPVEIIEASATANTPADAVEESRAPTGVAITSRRALLKWGGLGAAALAAAGTAALSTTPVAHAADGDDLVLGTFNGASTRTSLTFSLVSNDQNAPDVGFEVVNGTVYPDDSVFLKSAIRGVSDGIGVLGVAGSRQSAVMGFANVTGYDLHANGTGVILQKTSGTVGPRPGYDITIGELIRDNNGDMYLCMNLGNNDLSIPPLWKRLASLTYPYKGGAVGLLPTPVRIYDTRTTGGPFHGNAARDIQISANVPPFYPANKVPFGAVGCIGNLTVTNPTAGGYAVIYPQGSNVPSTSTVNFLAGQTRANSFIVGLGSTGKVTIHTFTSGQCDVILDITGFIS